MKSNLSVIQPRIYRTLTGLTFDLRSLSKYTPNLGFWTKPRGFMLMSQDQVLFIYPSAYFCSKTYTRIKHDISWYKQQHAVYKISLGLFDETNTTLLCQSAGNWSKWLSNEERLGVWGPRPLHRGAAIWCHTNLIRFHIRCHIRFEFVENMSTCWWKGLIICLIDTKWYYIWANRWKHMHS